MISPTGRKIRMDSEGSGHLGARRGDRIHRGIDHEGRENQTIVAPHDMHIDRISYPNSDIKLSGIAWSYGRSEGRLWYFKPYPNLIGKDVIEGQEIGILQSVSRYYNKPNMKDHTHYQVNK